MLDDHALGFFTSEALNVGWLLYSCEILAVIFRS
jgi:hypothetical protein